LFDIGLGDFVESPQKWTNAGRFDENARHFGKNTWYFR